MIVYHPSETPTIVCPSCGTVCRGPFLDNEEVFCPECNERIGFFHRDEVGGIGFFFRNL